MGRGRGNLNVGTQGPPHVPRPRVPRPRAQVSVPLSVTAIYHRYYKITTSTTATTAAMATTATIAVLWSMGDTSGLRGHNSEFLHQVLPRTGPRGQPSPPSPCLLIANEAADPRGSAVEWANHRAVREYRRKISSQRKTLF